MIFCNLIFIFLLLKEYLLLSNAKYLIENVVKDYKKDWMVFVCNNMLSLLKFQIEDKRQAFQFGN